MDYNIVPMAGGHIKSYHDALSHVVREGRYLTFTEPPPFEKSRKFIELCIEKGIPQMAVVSGGACVGWCDICPQDGQPATRHIGSLGMGLLPAFRGRGIGAELMRKTIDRAREKGLVRIELSVFEGNARAIALYKKLGFVTEGLNLKAHRHPDDSYENVYMMALVF